MVKLKRKSLTMNTSNWLSDCRHQTGLHQANNEELAACPCPYVPKHISWYVTINDAINLRIGLTAKNYWITVRSVYVRTFYFFHKNIFHENIFHENIFQNSDKLSVLISSGWHKTAHECISPVYQNKVFIIFNTVGEYWQMFWIFKFNSS